MSVDEYVTSFTEKMKLFPYLVPTELSKIDRFANGLPANFGATVKMATTLKASIRAAKNVEIQLREKGLERVEVGEKRRFVGSSRSENKNRFLKSDPNNNKYGDCNEERWCDKYRRKHIRRCPKDVTCFKCGRIGHYDHKCTTQREVCFKCGGEGHFK